MKIPAYIKNLKPYVPGRPIEEIQKEYNLEKINKLASNENPLGPSPKAIEAMLAVTSGLNRYPDIGAIELREKISQKFNIKIENIAVGNGSEGIMANILRSFLSDGDEMITSKATFIGFQVLARGRANKFIEVPMLENEYKYDLQSILKHINENTKIIYLCNPNNPTGTIFNKKEFDEFVKKVPESVLIILDEAYFEYAESFPEYPDSLKYRLDNVITLRTFSKIYGIAGARIGYGFGNSELIETLMKVKLPFEPSNLAQSGAIGALDDVEFINKSKELNKSGYKYLINELEKISEKKNFKIIPSYANFLMLDLGTQDRVNNINNSLLKEGVIIRPLIAFGLPHCIRITMGLDEENKAFIESFKKYI
ncbi:MAG: histidinol-phosphate transaminase [Ignavibacteria bacterium]|jgi:histidinol-phosphate aminotransferase